MPDRPMPPPPPPVVCNACRAVVPSPRRHCQHCTWWHCPVCSALNSKTGFNPPIAGWDSKVAEWAKKHGVTTTFRSSS